MIPQQTVQEILDTAKIEDIVEQYVTLKKRGANMLGLCPFHNEKTPSFTVSPTKNIFKCFGCGKGGNPVQFLMEHDGFTFPEALRHLAERYNIEIEEIKPSKEAIEAQQLHASLFIVNQYAKDFFHDQLMNTDKGKSVGLNYFKERGFREETIKKFGLGYAPSQKDAFTLKAINDGYKVDTLKDLGLTSQYDRDFFRDRVMFSIHNLTGKVIGFGGRILVKNVKAPKYVNSPDSSIYNKSKSLYGAYFAKKAIRQLDECILVEGYTDVISLHQAGIENVVASSGTSLTVDQIRLIKRNTPNIKILYDGDTAGVKAALRGLDLVLEQDMNVRVVLLPTGEDPDSHLKNIGTTAFKEYIDKEANDFILFKTKLLLEEAAGDPVKTSNVIKDIVASIARVPDNLKRSLFIKECANLVGVEEKVLINATNSMIIEQNRKKEQAKERERARENYKRNKPETSRKNNDGSFPSANDDFPTTENEPWQGEDDWPDERGTPTIEPKDTPRKKKAIGDEYQERYILMLLMNFGDKIFDKDENITVAHFILSNIQDVIDEFDNPFYESIVKECLQLLADKKTIQLSYFVNHQDEKIRTLAVDLSTSQFEFSPNWKEMHGVLLNQKEPEQNFNKDSKGSVLLFKMKKLNKMIDKNKQKLLEHAQDEKEYMKCLKIQMHLNKIRGELAKQIGRVV